MTVTHKSIESGKQNDYEQALSTMMDRVMYKVLVEDPFIKEKHHSLKHLYAALVPDEIFKGSHFERRFITPFGGVWEKLAQVVAQEAHGECLMSHTLTDTVGEDGLRRIQEVLKKLEHAPKGTNRILPNWQEDLDYIKICWMFAIPMPTRLRG